MISGRKGDANFPRELQSSPEKNKTGIVNCTVLLRTTFIIVVSNTVALLLRTTYYVVVYVL